ncbi:MAG: hypothetical protein AAFR99_05770 [Cyanobacteria bacterium J06629_9]
MADITAAEMNTQLGVSAFDDNTGAGPLTLNLDLLTGDSMTLASNLAESIFKLVKGASETAAANEKATDTYPALTRTVATVNGEQANRFGASVNVTAPLSYDEVTSLS